MKRPLFVSPASMKRALTLTALVPAAVVALLLMPASPASAHPLGKFSVNQYVGLTLRADRVDAHAVIDLAEIPTLQDRPKIDVDSSGSASATERAAYASAQCAAVASAIEARAGAHALQWTVSTSDFHYSDGTGGLPVSRLSCELSAPASLIGAGEVSVDNGYLADRIGWREITAVGDGLGLINPPVPATSVTDELREYPVDPLEGPLDVRSVALRLSAGPGAGPSIDSAGTPLAAGGDPVSRWMATVDRQFQSLAGGQLTPLVVLLTVGLALVLGAGHAALPGHGKTVLAAYLAGKRGRPRDAVTVAGTVTLTHTGGVLVLGLLLTAGTAIAGERILGWLGLASGIVVLAIGATMLAGLVRGRRHLPGHHHHDLGHGHPHGHGNTHGHGHSHEPGHSHGHSHDDHTHGEHAGHDHPHPHGPARRTRGRWGLAGVGLAGGLVPSPSALIVLLAAIGLGRAGYGILLVVVYGAGMALTLTGAGLLLLALQRRIERRADHGGLATRLSRLASRLNAATPAATAALVVVVGFGIAARSAAGIV